MNTNLVKLILHVAPPFLLFFLIIYLHPFRFLFEYNLDEGGNLMKALLLLQDYSLYSQIWSDQPPFFTHLLALIFRLTDINVNYGRVLVLTFSSLLIWAIFQIQRNIWGIVSAITSTILIVALPEYTQLSVSVMIGLPSISMAMVALMALVIWHRNKKYAWLIMSAFALIISIFIKLFTGFLVPIFLIGIILDQYDQFKSKKPIPWRTGVQPVLIWGVSFFFFFIIFGVFYVGIQNIPNITIPHILARSIETYQELSNILSINYYLNKLWALLLLSIIGTVFSIISKHWLALYFTAWMGIAYILLSTHKPVWSHQQLIVTVPAERYLV